MLAPPNVLSDAVEPSAATSVSSLIVTTLPSVAAPVTPSVVERVAAVRVVRPVTPSVVERVAAVRVVICSRRPTS